MSRTKDWLMDIEERENTQRELELNLDRILSETRGEPGLSIKRVSDRIKGNYHRSEIDSLIKELLK